MARRSRRELILRIFIFFLAAGVLWLAFDHIVLVRARAPLPELQPHRLAITTLTSSSKAARLAWPSSGQAATGLSGYGVLATSGPQTPLPTASVAKLITVLAVLRTRPIAPGTQGATLTLGQQDVNYYHAYAAEDGSVAAVSNGEQITEYQMLQGMLLPSANNLADSLAVWAFGSLKAYSAYANRMLPSLGLHKTHVGSDASGFQPDTTSTAADLVRLGELASANPVIAGITAQKSAALPVAGTVINVNWLLGTAGIDGLKTGNSNEAGGVFLSTAAYLAPSGQKVTIVTAVMHAPTLQQAMDSTVPLLVSSQKALTYTTALVAGQAVGQYDVPWQSSVTAVTAVPLKALAWQGRPLGRPTVTLLDTLRAPQPGQAAVGTADFRAESGNPATSSPLKLAQPIPAPSLWWRLLHG